MVDSTFPLAGKYKYVKQIAPSILTAPNVRHVSLLELIRLCGFGSFSAANDLFFAIFRFVTHAWECCNHPSCSVCLSARSYLLNQFWHLYVNSDDVWFFDSVCPFVWCSGHTVLIYASSCLFLQEYHSTHFMSPFNVFLKHHWLWSTLQWVFW